MNDYLDPVVNSLKGLFVSFLENLPLFVIGFIFIVVTWILSRVIKRALYKVFDKTKMRPSLKSVIERLVTIAVWVLGLGISALVIFPSLEFKQAVTALGFGSIAIGFVFKDIFENFIAGIFILWQVPFEEGDYIECQEIQGFVIDIKLRYTFLRKVDGECIVVPNSLLFMNPVYIKTELDHHRVTIICGVAYGENVDESRQVIYNSVEGLSTVRKEKPIQIFAQEFADSSINFEVTWWTGSKPEDIRRSKDQVVAAVKAGLDKAGIEIPFPYRTLTFKENSPIKIHQLSQMAQGKDTPDAEDA